MGEYDVILESTRSMIARPLYCEKCTDLDLAARDAWISFLWLLTLEFMVVIFDVLYVQCRLQVNLCACVDDYLFAFIVKV